MEKYQTTLKNFKKWLQEKQMSKKVLSQYKGDPFPLRRREFEQMKGSRALGRQWTRYKHSVEREIERGEQRRKAREMYQRIRGY